MESPSLPSPFSRVLKHLRVFVAKYLSSSSGDGKVGDKGTERRMERERERERERPAFLAFWIWEKKRDRISTPTHFSFAVAYLRWGGREKKGGGGGELIAIKNFSSPLRRGGQRGEGWGLCLFFPSPFLDGSWCQTGSQEEEKMKWNSEH